MTEINSKTKDTQRQLDEFREKCRRNKINITPQRVAIYSILTESRNHPTAEDIFNLVRQSFPDISIDTVYRTLSTFTQMGLLDVVEGYGEAKRYDPDIEPHHHFRCKKCNEIIDFQETTYNNIKAPAEIESKYHVTNIKVVVEGLCKKCEKQN